jgi:hypothetical protein
MNSWPKHPTCAKRRAVDAYRSTREEMYRFPDDLDRSHLTGCEVVQVSHAPYNLLFSLKPDNRINIVGAWRLLDSDAQVIDQGNEQEQKESYRTHRLLGHKI